MKNIQVIDDAVNARYAIYAVTDDEFALLFPGEGQDVEFIEDIVDRIGEDRTSDLMGPIWEVMDRLVDAGGRVIRPADAPPHGGFRGYVADPDDHAWEIAWNPAWHIDENGLASFAV